MQSQRKIDKPLGQILVEHGLINHSQLKNALNLQKNYGGLIGEKIIELGFAREEDIDHCLCLQFGYPYLPLENYQIASEVLDMVPKNLCTRFCVIPLDKTGKTLTVAMADPLNNSAIKALENITRCDVQVFVSTSSDIRRSIEEFY